MKKYKSAKIIIVALIILILGVNTYSRAENEVEETNNTQTENTTTNETENTNTSTDTNTTKEEKQTEPVEEEKQEEQQEQQEDQVEEKKEENNNQPQTETKKSSNANLSDLGINPNDFKGFKAGTLSYNVTVPNDVEKVNVYAKLQDSKAKITSGTGNQDLKVGKNALNVVVTAEDGTTKTYTINVTREEAKQEEKQEEKKEENTAAVTTTTTKPASDLKKLEVKGYSLTPSFSGDVYEYKLDISKDVSSLDIVAEGQNDKISVEIVGNTDLQDGENTITILVKNSETNKNSTYQIIANKKEQKAVNPQVEKGNNIRLILAGLFAVVVIAIILTFIIMKKKQNDDDIEMEEPRARIKNQRKYDLEENDEDEEERINLDDEKELFKRVNKSDFKSVENRQIPQNRPNNLERNSTRRPENLQNNNARRREYDEDNASRRPRALDDYFSDPNNQKGRHF